MLAENTIPDDYKRRKESERNFPEKGPAPGPLSARLARDYEVGKFTDLEKDLADFIRQHRADIRKLRDTELAGLKGLIPNDELALRLYILKSRSINPEDDIRLELNEIQKIIAAEAKSGGKVDPNKIAQEWSRTQAPRWRDYWVLGALYVFERNKEKYLSILQEEVDSKQ